MADNTTEGASTATIVVAVILVLIVGLAFYFGLVRDNDAIGGPEETTNVEFVEPGTQIEQDSGEVAPPR